jgi:serine/threonine protein kinase
MGKPPAVDLDSVLPPELSALLRRCFAIEPAERPSCAQVRLVSA